MIDIHNHILPEIDDGAIDEQMTLQMLRIAARDGIRIIIATPHYHYPKYIASTKEIIKKVEMANQLAKAHEIPIKVLPGQEVMIDRYTLQHIKEGKISSLAGTNYLLVEFSLMKWKSYYLDIIYELQLMGYTLVVAHPERYIYIQEDITNINPLIQEGVLFQVNAGSVTGLWGEKAQKTAHDLINQGAIQFIASDAHSKRTRKPVLKEALNKVAQMDMYIATQMQEHPYKILSNQVIDSQKNRVRKRTLFAFFDTLFMGKKVAQ